MYRKFAFFDLLRFVGAIIVVLYHVPLKSNIHDFIPLFLKDGYLWVFFYFMISGFLSAYFYKGENIDAFDYAKRKIMKIYPIYFLNLILIFVSIGYKFKLIEYVAPLLLIQTWLLRYLPFSDPGWYLSALLFLNLCFPFLIKFASKNKIKFIILNIVLIIFTAFFINKFMFIYKSYNYTIKELYYISHFFPPVMLGVFMSGISLFFISEKIKKSNLFSYFIIAYVLFLSVFVTSRDYITSIIIFSPLILFTSADTGFLSKVFDNKFIRFLSGLSFPIYILHMSLVYVLASFIPNFRNSNKLIIFYYVFVLFVSIFVHMLQNRYLNYIKRKKTIS